MRLREQADLDALLATLVALSATEPETPVLVVDDASAPEPGRVAEAAAAELGQAFVTQEDGSGHAAAVNVGLEVAAANGMDAALVRPGVEPLRPGWIARLRARTDTKGRPAAVVGGTVLYRDDLVRHAGYYFSLFRRAWAVRFRNAPHDVPELAEPCLCPVGDELQLIRHACLEAVGLYDARFEAGSGDIDYCLRAVEAGLETVHEPAVRARCQEEAQPPRKADDATAAAVSLLRAKHGHTDFGRWVPEVL